MAIVGKNKAKVKNLSDGELITVIRMKNQDLYREIVRRYQGKLFVYLYRLVGSKEEVEDILQNVFVKVYKNLKKFDTSKKFSSWIYRIAHNEAVNFLKRKSKKHFISWEDVLDERKVETRSEEKSPIDLWIGKESQKEIQEAIQKLPARYREVLRLRYYSDQSYEEIGKKLGKSVNTVGTLINRAKKKLSEIMKK